MNRLFVCASVIALAGAAYGETGYEGNTWNVPGDFATIQDAIDNAAPGDTICLIGAGPFAPFTLNVDDITIKGADLRPAPQPEPMGCDFKVNKKLDQDNTRPVCEDLPSIDGGGTTGSLITANGATIIGVCFTNGKDSHFNGGALKVADNASASLSYVVFDGNKADEDGGALWVGRNSSVSVNNAVFSNNEAEFGGAIQAGQGATLSLTDVDFNNNLATGSGGAIDLLAAASVSIEASCFIGNEAETTVAGFGGAISMFLTPVEIKNAVFCDNSAIRGGGAIYNEDGDLDIWYSTFWNNTSLSGGGIEQLASPSAGSEPISKTDITNSAIVSTRLVNNIRGSVPDADAIRMEVFYSFYDRDFAGEPRVRGLCGVIGLADLPVDASTGEQITPADLFVDAANCDFHLVYSPCWDNPLIDSADSRACADLCFDKDDNGRAIDVVDNPSTGLVDEGIENTGVDIWLRNHTCDAADMGAYEYKQAPFSEILVSCEGDADFDGDVDIDDIFVVLRKFGYPCVLSDGCTDTESDGGFQGGLR
ncbi:MAG: hypothetical protein Tsb0013_14170 [Phycisphaerales bacterium]